MQIREILASHDSYSVKSSHPDILGDPFLTQANSIYRNIKHFALKIGCEYTEAWPQYLLLPFHELNKIVMTKKIPYVPSARMLREIEDKRPDVFTGEDLRMPESYHLHEASHVIAEHLFADVALTGAQEKILKMILCESFANTVDALAGIPAEDEMHRFFLDQNCYMHPSKGDRGILSRLQERLGWRCTFMLCLFAYVHANFLQERFSRKRIKELVAQYAPDIKLSEKILKDCDGLVRLAEKLDPRFRVQTTEMYLKLEGYDGDLLELLNFPYMQVYADNPKFRSVTEAMAAVVTTESLGS